MQPTRETLARLSDIMRIISALLIFYYHAGLFVTLPLSRYGDFAVNTFIMLAIVASIAFTRAKTEPGLAEYMWRRVKRIFPLYFSINIAIFAASYLYPSRLGQPFTFRQFLLSSTGLSIVFGDRFLSEVFWFIPFIFQVYLVLGFFGNRLLRLNWRPLVLAALVVSAIEIILLSRLMGEGLIETRKWSPLLRLPELLFGLMTAAAAANVVAFPEYLANVAFYSAGAIALGCSAFLIPHAAYLFMLPLNGVIVTAVITALSAAILLVFASAGISTSALRFAGRATFPFFLIHGIGLRFIDSRWHSQTLAWLGYLATCIAAAVVLELIFGSARATKALSRLSAR